MRRDLGSTTVNGAKARVAVSRRARPLHPVAQAIVDNLSRIDVIRFVRVTPGFLQASSQASGPRSMPVTTLGHPTAVGISLIFEADREELQFYEITSAVKGYGSRMVEAVLKALPRTWTAVVIMDWSDGFWQTMRQRHRRIVLL
jgi:hypothetical protein